MELRLKYPSKKLVLIGAAAEINYVSKIAKNFNDSFIINTAGKTNFAELISIIENADMLITNDTGPMHLAAACGVKTVALFGPCSPDQYGAIENVIPIYENLYCSPCVHEFDIPPCLGDNQCMKKIQTHRVLEIVNSEHSKNESKEKSSYFSKSGIVLGRVIRKHV